MHVGQWQLPAVVSAPLLVGVKPFDSDPNDTFPFDAEFAGGSRRKIDNAACDMRSAIIDSNFGRAAILEVGDSDDGSEREAAMGSGHGQQIERLAAGGWLALMCAAIP